jgi:hypothetical protein
VLVFVMVFERFEACAWFAGDEHEDYVDHDGCPFWVDMGSVQE